MGNLNHNSQEVPGAHRIGLHKEVEVLKISPVLTMYHLLKKEKMNQIKLKNNRFIYPMKYQ